jgi:hypothetical protein
MQAQASNSPVNQNVRPHLSQWLATEALSAG